MAYTLKQARQWVAGKVTTTTGTPCYEYEPAVTDETVLKSLFGTRADDGTRVVRGWTLTRESAVAVSDTEEGEIDYTFHRQYTLVLRGYYLLDNSQHSELTFQDDIEAVLDALDAAPTLGSNCDDSGPPTVRRVDHRFYGNILCHACEIVLPVTMRRDRIA